MGKGKEGSKACVDAVRRPSRWQAEFEHRKGFRLQDPEVGVLVFGELKSSVQTGMRIDTQQRSWDMDRAL